MILEFIYDKSALGKEERKFLADIYEIAKKDFEAVEGLTKVTQFFPHECIEIDDAWENAIYPGETSTIPTEKQGIASEIILNAMNKARSFDS
jgi:hypothetical protein